MKKTGLFIIIPFFAFSALGQSKFKITIPHVWDFGIIASDSLGRDSLGTGFLIEKNEVITCAHVAGGKKYLFYIPCESKRSFRIQLRKIMYVSDLALYKSSEKICDRFFKIANNFIPFLGDSIIYIGYNTIENGLHVDFGVISAYGKLYGSKKIPVFFLEFKGFVIPGYSGGPILDRRGRVIGIITQAFYQRGIKASISQEYILCKGFSILPILANNNQHPALLE